MVTKIKRVTDLVELTRIYDGMKTVVAYNKNNYLIDLSKIKGRKITSITADQSDESSGKNSIYIHFADGSVESFYVYNGSKGDQGKQGLEGAEGNQGEDAYVDTRRAGITGVMPIINNSTTVDPSLPWSAFRGKDMNEKIYDLNETFLTDEEYSRLFENISFIYAEFKTTEENKGVVLFNADPNPHTEYVKYWTYEESSIQTYYVYNPISDTYDPVEADLWKDIYLGNKEGYFPATNNMLTDGTALYYIDNLSGEYKPVTLVENESTGNYIGDKYIHYYAKEIDTYLHANYARIGNIWSFSIDSDEEIIPEIYTLEGSSYVKIDDPYSIDTTVFGQYFKKNSDGTYEEIGDIASEIQKRSIRIYYRSDDNKYVETEVDYGQLFVFNGKNYTKVADTKQITEEVEYYYFDGSKYIAIENILEYIWNLIEEKDEGNLSISNGNDYIITSTNPISKVFTILRNRPEIEYGSTVYYKDTYQISNIDLYYYTSTRDYYDTKIEYTEDEEGNRTYNQVYILIEVPSWIYAEFVTTDEDQNTLILNSITKLGDEDNTIIDPTAEETENPETDNISILRIVPGNKEDIYIKTADNNYKKVDLNTDIIYDSSEYYLISNEFDYIPVTADYIRANNIIEFYYLENDEYVLGYTYDLLDNVTYYIKEIIYERLNNPKEYLSTYDLTLIIGEPQVLPINIYPINATDKKVIIDYNPNLIKFYEDGRIAATIGDSFETQLILSNEDESIKSYVNVKLITQLRTIELSKRSGSSDIGGNDEFTYTVNDTATNKNVIWTSSNEEVATIEVLENNTIKVNAISKGFVNIEGIAEDGFGASARFTFESIQPAESIRWNQDEVIFVDDICWTEMEVNRFYMQYAEAIASGEMEDPNLIPDVTVKVPAHYEMTGLLFKEYRLTPEILPEDTSYPQIVWGTTNPEIAEVITKQVKVIDQEERTYLADQSDIDNNLATEIGEEITIPEISHMETGYFIKSYATGNVEITGFIERQSGLSISVSLTINQSIETVTVTPSILSANIGTVKKLSYTTAPIEGTVTWSSEDPDIVSVSPDGTITMLTGGATRIIATANDGSETFAFCTVTSTIPMHDINLSGNDNNGIVYVGIGNTTEISAEILYDENHTEGPKLGLDWNVSDDSIISIQSSDDTKCVVSGLSLGNSTLIATAKDGSGVFGTIQIKVIKLAESISFNHESVEMDVDDTIVLVPVFSPIDASNEIVIWRSSDETVAKVKNSGIVYALSSGEATITIMTTDGTELEASCTITVL